MPTARQTAAQKALAAVAEEPEPSVKEEPATNVVEAWSRVMRDMPAIHKENRMQGSGGYNFRSIEQFTAHASVLMARHGVIVVPVASNIEYVEVGKTNSGAVVVEARGKWEWRIFGPGGITDYIDAASFGQGRDSSDKAANKAATAAFKYLLMPALMISDNKEDPEFERPEATPEPEPDPIEVEKAQRYAAIMARASALKDIDEKYIVGLRAQATHAGYETVNAWGREHLDDFEHCVAELEEQVKQAASGEPEETP